MWLSVDPVARLYPNKTPFNFSGNNPINTIDPNGMWEEKADGSWTAEKGDSWWSLHEQSGMTWKETMDYAKQFNNGRGVSNWKFVGVGDNVMTLTAEESYDYQNGSSISSREVYDIAVSNAAERFLESTPYSSSNKGAEDQDYTSALTGAGFAMGVQGDLLSIASKSKHATSAAKTLAKGTTGVGIGIALLQINEISKNSSLSTGQKVAEGVTAAIGAVPVIGVAWTAGWEIGRCITQNAWYQETVHGKRNPNKSLFLDGE